MHRKTQLNNYKAFCQGLMDLTGQVCLEGGYEDGPIDMIRYGVFPISPKKYVYISFETLDLISTVKNFNPLLSNGNVAIALNFISTKRPLAFFIRPEVFNTVLRGMEQIRIL